MEIVSPLALWVAWYASGASEVGLCMCLWTLHYFNRAIVFPLQIRTAGKRIPWLIVGSAAAFNVVNGGLNGLALSHGDIVSLSSISVSQSIGFILFLVGEVINLRSDALLRVLRKPGETGYKIPRGFLFRWISCPNHLGEIIAWSGFALLAQNWAALSFAVWTVANLTPRALAHHRWYREKFDAYPKTRRALIPFVL